VPPRLVDGAAMTTRPIVILGNGGHARVVADICRAAEREVRGFLDHDAVRRDGEPGARYSEAMTFWMTVRSSPPTSSSLGSRTNGSGSG